MEPGEHAFECRFHKDAGMVGTLVVRAAAAPATAPAPGTPAASPRDEATQDRDVGGLALGMGLLTVGLCAFILAAGRRGHE